jgi:hypothetical protein
MRKFSKDGQEYDWLPKFPYIPDDVRIYEMLDHDDQILWHSNHSIPNAQYRIRYPPKSAVAACIIKCPFCKNNIDIAFQWLELHSRDNEEVFDIDCPHCPKTMTITSKTTLSKLVKFRKRCIKWAEPPVQKAGRVTASLRFKILKRDNFRCTYCGANPQQSSLHIDHKTPIRAKCAKYETPPNSSLGREQSNSRRF